MDDDESNARMTGVLTRTMRRYNLDDATISSIITECILENAELPTVGPVAERMREFVFQLVEQIPRDTLSS